MVGVPYLTIEQREESKERRRAQDRARHERDKEKRNEARRNAHASNPERLRKIERDRYRDNPLANKLIDVKSKYGVAAVSHFLSVHHCESCSDHVSGRSKHIDHDHSKPKTFRGILCNSCNIALGHLREDPKRIEKLLGYINRTGKKSMKTFNKVCAQGDVYITRIDISVPAGAIKCELVNGKVEIAHSETGHSHVMSGDGVTLYRLPDTIMECLLVVDKPSVLEHLRSFDTHEPIRFEPGVYKVRRQREYTPEGFRRVED